MQIKSIPIPTAASTHCISLNSPTCDFLLPFIDTGGLSSMALYTELYKIIELNLFISSGNMIESRGQVGQKKLLKLGMNWE